MCTGEIRCPRCGSMQISGQRKGFGVGKAAFGALLFGPLGLLGGLVGSKNTVVACLNCGNRWAPTASRNIQDIGKEEGHNKETTENFDIKSIYSYPTNKRIISYAPTKRRGKIAIPISYDEIIWINEQSVDKNKEIVHTLRDGDLNARKCIYEYLIDDWENIKDAMGNDLSFSDEGIVALAKQEHVVKKIIEVLSEGSSP